MSSVPAVSADGPICVGMVAGELSGDLLGAGLISALQSQLPNSRVEGVGGDRMAAAGCHIVRSSSELAVMGLVEVLRHIPRLLKLRKELLKHFVERKPAVFIGIDAPDFTIPLELKLRRRGILTVHYVSPSVWAWRRYRVKRIAQSVDLILTLFPFEAEFYRRAGVPVVFVGHPLADEIPIAAESESYRAELGLVDAGPWVAVLPGSRETEVNQLLEPFLETAAWLHERLPSVRFLIPAATFPLKALIHEKLERYPRLSVRVIDGQSRQVMGASDAVLLASGTATLEALLLKKPMVVGYRLAPVTFWLARRLVKIPHFALPNLLAGDRIVEEFLQEDVVPGKLGPALLESLTNPGRRQELVRRFAEIHQQLRRDASAEAARAVAELLSARCAGGP